jgi:predicted protein tyrosine phosphatase
MVGEHDIVIADRTAAGKILCAPARCAELGYVISIGGPMEREAAGCRNVARRLRLVFDDAATLEEGGPSAADVEQLIRFARQVDLTKGKLLVHCQAGISRSSAAAIIVLAVLGGPGHERAAVAHIRRIHPSGRPNVRMLGLADTILETNGALLQASQTS